MPVVAAQHRKWLAAHNLETLTPFRELRPGGFDEKSQKMINIVDEM